MSDVRIPGIWWRNGSFSDELEAKQDFEKREACCQITALTQDVCAYRNSHELAVLRIGQLKSQIELLEQQIKDDVGSKEATWLRCALKDLGATESQIESLAKGGDDAEELWPGKKPLKGGKRAMKP